MKLRLLDQIVCPKDQTELRLVPWTIRPVNISKEHQRIASEMKIEIEQINKEICDGVLVNHHSKIIYPIIDSIPRLLLFPTFAMTAFFAKNRERLTRDLPGYKLPDFNVPPSEREEARAFEYQIFGNDADATASDKAIVDALVSSLELLLNTQNRSLEHNQVLDVGLGVGSVAGRFAEKQKCELVGMDVSHLVDAAQKTLENYPLYNLVQASVLAPPFRKSTFDLVYSYGGLNRCSVPKQAVQKMSSLPKKGGRISIWFDDDKSSKMSAIQKMLVQSEKWIRPLVSHFPRRVRSYAIMTCTPMYLMHQRLYSEHYANASLSDGVKGALAVAQQRLEMHIRQKLDDKEVRAWIELNGFSSVNPLRTRAHPPTLPLALWNCAGVEGVRT